MSTVVWVILILLLLWYTKNSVLTDLANTVGDNVNGGLELVKKGTDGGLELVKKGADGGLELVKKGADGVVKSIKDNSKNIYNSVKTNMSEIMSCDDMTYDMLPDRGPPQVNVNRNNMDEIQSSHGMYYPMDEPEPVMPAGYLFDEKRSYVGCYRDGGDVMPISLGILSNRECADQSADLGYNAYGMKYGDSYTYGKANCRVGNDRNFNAFGESLNCELYGDSIIGGSGDIAVYQRTTSQIYA